jgi:hypothetical protein
MVIGLAKLHFVDSKLALDEWRTLSYLAPLKDDGGKVQWAEAKVSASLKARLETEPRDGASFAPLPGAALRAASYSAWGKSLTSHLYETSRVSVWVCDALKASAAPDESERDFRARLALQARERRDAAVEDLRRKYAPKFAALEERARRASERVEREKSQLAQQKMSTALSVGASILGAFLGRRRISAATIDKATAAARSADRIGRESQDVDRAGESLEALQSRQHDLQEHFNADAAAIDRGFDAAAIVLRKVAIAPRKADIAVGEVALVWTPWRRGSDGFPAPAFSQE